MRLSTSTNIYFNRPDGTKADITESIRRCWTAGYRVMDMNFHDAHTFIADFSSDRDWRGWLDRIVAAQQEYGMEFSQAHLPFYNICQPEQVDAERLDVLVRRAIDGCAELGVPWAVTHVGTAYGVDRPRSESIRRNREYLVRLADYASERGVGIAIENLWDLNIAPLVRFGSTAEELMELLDVLPQEGFGVCWDFEHAAIMRQSQSASLELVGRRLVATHVSDYLDVTADHLLPFHGATDWTEAMAALGRTGYRGDLTFEVHRLTQRAPEELVDELLRHSITVGRLLLQLAGETTPAESR